MKVSIVIPSYNQVDYIAETLDSIFNQTYPLDEIEVIVVDACSDDGTLEVIRNHPLNLTLISEIDQGQSDGINKGLRIAAGHVVTWLNSDDYYFEDTIERIVSVFIENSGVEVVSGAGINVDVDGELIAKHPAQAWSFNRMTERTSVCQPATFFRKSALLKAGYLNIRLHYAMDYELFLRFAKNCKVKVVDEVLAANRVHSLAKTQKFKLQSRIEVVVCSWYYRGQKWSWEALSRLAYYHSKRICGGCDSSGRRYTMKIMIILVYKVRIFLRMYPYFSSEMRGVAEALREDN
ncbi:MAG TPA: hypothetical protein DCX14_13730 [Flavobacteriales bacterium]|nr:hypothetical protein [Flavobacteriales bacterium]